VRKPTAAAAVATAPAVAAAVFIMLSTFAVDFLPFALRCLNRFRKRV